MPTASAVATSAKSPPANPVPRRTASPAIAVRTGSYAGRYSPPVRTGVVRLLAAAFELCGSRSPDMDGCHGFVRGLDGAPAYIRADGTRIHDPRLMRTDCLALSDHLEALSDRAGRALAAATSFGNLGPNDEYVLYWEEDGKGKVACCASEMERLRSGRLYFALGETRNGLPWAGRLRFRPTVAGFRPFDHEGRELAELHIAFTGPPVVWEGEALGPEATWRSWRADLRHLFTLIPCPLPKGGSKLLGEAELLADDLLLAEAVCGDPVSLPLVWAIGGCREEPMSGEAVAALVREAERRGYTLVPNGSCVREPGQIAVCPERADATICFLPGVYPMNLLGVSASGEEWINMQVCGVSTRSGCTVAEAGELMREEGAQFALCLDQGADCQMLVRQGEHYLYRPSFNFRGRVSAVLAWFEHAGYALTG